jgi:Fic family protein
MAQYLKGDNLCGSDPLVKIAIIHPFYDGKGRTGSILNILYLMARNLFNLPVLYLSRFIIHHMAADYNELQAVRETRN